MARLASLLWVLELPMLSTSHWQLRYTNHDCVRPSCCLPGIQSPSYPQRLLALSSPLHVVCSMEYPANMPDSTKSYDEEHSFEVAVTPTRTTSAANATRSISAKLLDWRAEERGGYRIFFRG